MAAVDLAVCCHKIYYIMRSFDQVLSSSGCWPEAGRSFSSLPLALACEDEGWSEVQSRAFI